MAFQLTAVMLAVSVWLICPFFSSKVYRLLVRHWRSLSFPGIMFLGGFFEADYDSAVVHSEHVKKDIVCSGSIFSIKKSNFTPSQKMTMNVK